MADFLGAQITTATRQLAIKRPLLTMLANSGEVKPAKEAAAG